MIKMKAIVSANMGENGAKVRRGREFLAANESRANELEAHGLAYRLQTRAIEPPAEIGAAQPNKAADSGPLDSRGGRTGADDLAPSSHQDPPRQPRRSRRFRGGSTS